jgi:hypothetical protein
MTFEEILDQAIAMLQRRGRMTYRTLQRQFALDDDALTDLKDELLYTHPEIHDDAGRGLIWTGDLSIAPPATSPPASTQDRAPLSYTPWAGKNKPAPNSPLLSPSTAPWTCSSGYPRPRRR